VLDAACALDDSDAVLVKNADERAIICLNKSDLPAVLSAQQLRDMTDARIMEISAQTGMGISGLIDELTRRVALDGEREGQLMARRHIELAQAAADCLAGAVRSIREDMPLDTAAIDIREALERLTEITGENATEAVIDRVFADFCVGK